MNKIIISLILVVFAIGFLSTGSEAEAMNNESAALLAGAIAIFGRPVLQAVAGEILPVGPTPVPALYYSEPEPYPATVRIVRHHHHRNNNRYCDHRRRGPYERGWRDEWENNEYRRGREDARERYYGE